MQKGRDPAERPRRRIAHTAVERAGIELDLAELDAGQNGPPEPAAPQVRASQVRARQAGAGEVHLGEPRIGQPHLAHRTVGEIHLEGHIVRLGLSRRGRISEAEILGGSRRRQHRQAHVRFVEDGAGQVRAPQADAADVGAGEVRLSGVDVAQVGEMQAGALQVGADQPTALQVGAGQVRQGHQPIAEIEVRRLDIAQDRLLAARLAPSETFVRRQQLTQLGLGMAGLASAIRPGVSAVEQRQFDLSEHGQIRAL